MSPNPLPEARIAVIEDRLDRSERKRDQTEEKLDKISEQLTEIKRDLKWQRIIFWGMATFYAGVFLWFVLVHIPDKFNDKVPSDLKEQLTKLQMNVSSVQDQLKKLTPGSLNQLIPEPDSTANMSTITSNLRKAGRVIDVALTNGIPAEPRLLPPLRIRVMDILNRHSSNPKVVEAALSTAVRLDGYETMSQRTLAGLQPGTEAPTDTFKPSGYSYLMGFGMNCTNPGAHFLGISPPFNPEDMVVFRVQVHTCAQEMDGPNWIQDSFDGSTIEYNGGPLHLADVKFTNCNFKFGSDPKSVRALAAIKASNGAPISLLLE